MAARQFHGTIKGKDKGGNGAALTVYRKGGSYWLVNSSGYEHLVHPSNEKRGSEGLIREASIVFHLQDMSFSPA